MAARGVWCKIDEKEIKGIHTQVMLYMREEIRRNWGVPGEVTTHSREVVDTCKELLADLLAYDTVKKDQNEYLLLIKRWNKLLMWGHSGAHHIIRS